MEQEDINQKRGAPKHPYGLNDYRKGINGIRK